MPDITPPHHKLSVTFRLDQGSIEQDMAEARRIARQGIPVTIIVPPGVYFTEPPLLENNMTIQGQLHEMFKRLE